VNECTKTELKYEWMDERITERIKQWNTYTKLLFNYCYVCRLTLSGSSVPVRRLDRFSFRHKVQTALGSSQPHVQLIPWSLSTGVQWPYRKYDPSSVPSAKLKICGALHSFVFYASMRLTLAHHNFYFNSAGLIEARQMLLKEHTNNSVTKK
jgi:hypothetical protein